MNTYNEYIMNGEHINNLCPSVYNFLHVSQFAYKLDKKQHIFYISDVRYIVDIGY